MTNSLDNTRSFDISKSSGLRKSIIKMCTGQFEGSRWRNDLVVHKNLIIDVVIVRYTIDCNAHVKMRTLTWKRTKGLHARLYKVATKLRERSICPVARFTVYVKMTH